ncbi:MAG: SpoIID/LytB domain-containing protein [Comamonadaceae bacterium]|nr:SpoIID/LytB domain-containing protein [Comamonadaceae bacterium]
MRLPAGEARPGGRRQHAPAPAPEPGAGPARPAQALPATVRVRVVSGGARAGPHAHRSTTTSSAPCAPRCCRRRCAPQPPSRALDVQAIVSRTYATANLAPARRRGVRPVRHDALPGVPGPPQRAKVRATPRRAAVDATRGQILTFQGRAIQALFHADCGGHTASAASVWGGTDAPYLESVADWYCERRPASGWSFAEDEAAVARALNADARTRVGDRLRRVEIASRDASGRALAVTLVGSRTISVRAEVFRAVMTQAFGPRAIRSTWFEVRRDGPRLRFSGVGFGHGVGLCQSGTLRRVEARQSPAEILAHYFPGSRLQSASTASVRPDIAGRLFGR